MSVPSLITTNFPQEAERVKKALATTGYSIEFVDLPGRRSIIMLSQGKIALEIFRNTHAVEQFPNIIAIEPPIKSMLVNMITGAKTPEFCNKTENDFKEMSVAGMLGVELHATFYAPMFKQATTDLSSIEDVVEFVLLQRADVSFLPDEMISKLPRELRDQLKVCETHTTRFHFNTLIHRDYLWAKDKIEAAYREEFSNDQ